MAAQTSYGAIDLFMPKAIHERVSSVAGSGEGKPFRRMIDFWWAGLCLGVRAHQRVPMSGDSVKFIDGSIFASDPWRIVHLELLTLATEGEDAIKSASQVITRAQEYANWGMERLLDSLAGESLPALSLLTNIDDILADV